MAEIVDDIRDRYFRRCAMRDAAKTEAAKTFLESLGYTVLKPGEKAKAEKPAPDPEPETETPPEAETPTAEAADPAEPVEEAETPAPKKRGRKPRA